MQFSCYIEVNVLCLILIVIIYFRLLKNRSMESFSQIIMRKLLVAVCVLCVSDVIAIISRGRVFPGARYVIEISNLIYLMTMPVISMFWLLYVRSKIGIIFNRKQKILCQIPMLFMVICAVMNHFNSFLFSVNADNLYVRGNGIFLHWIVSWFYMFYAGILSVKAIRNSSGWLQRNEYRPLLIFLILPAIGCIAQMAIYGITTVQAGITLSLVLVSLQMQDNQISVDELTRINNRKAMRRYVESIVYRNNPPSLAIMMIDINQFKKINDTLGHSVGDIALQDTADLLNIVCEKAREHWFLCRYGGDEFVIIGQSAEEKVIKEMIAFIHQEVADYEREYKKPFQLEVSVGYSIGICKSYEDFESKLKEADAAMYEDKKKRG